MPLWDSFWGRSLASLAGWYEHPDLEGTNFGEIF
jgi:hypothetical protein